MSDKQLHKMSAEFWATPEEAKQLKVALEATASVFFELSKDSASRLFELGANAVVQAASAERAAVTQAAAPPPSSESVGLEGTDG